MSVLPNDVFIRIFLECDLFSLVFSGMACRLFRDLILDTSSLAYRKTLLSRGFAPYPPSVFSLSELRNAAERQDLSLRHGSFRVASSALVEIRELVCTLARSDKFLVGLQRFDNRVRLVSIHLATGRVQHADVVQAAQNIMPLQVVASGEVMICISARMNRGLISDERVSLAFYSSSKLEPVSDRHSPKTIVLQLPPDMNQLLDSQMCGSRIALLLSGMQQHKSLLVYDIVTGGMGSSSISNHVALEISFLDEDHIVLPCRVIDGRRPTDTQVAFFSLSGFTEESLSVREVGRLELPVHPICSIPTFSPAYLSTVTEAPIGTGHEVGQPLHNFGDNAKALVSLTFETTLLPSEESNASQPSPEAQLTLMFLVVFRRATLLKFVREEMPSRVVNLTPDFPLPPKIWIWSDWAGTLCSVVPLGRMSDRHVCVLGSRVFCADLTRPQIHNDNGDVIHTDTILEFGTEDVDGPSGPYFTPPAVDVVKEVGLMSPRTYNPEIEERCCIASYDTPLNGMLFTWKDVLGGADSEALYEAVEESRHSYRHTQKLLFQDLREKVGTEELNEITFVDLGSRIYACRMSEGFDDIFAIYTLEPRLQDVELSK